MKKSLVFSLSDTKKKVAPSPWLNAARPLMVTPTYISSLVSPPHTTLWLRVVSTPSLALWPPSHWRPAPYSRRAFGDRISVCPIGTRASTHLIRPCHTLALSIMDLWCLLGFLDPKAVFLLSLKARPTSIIAYALHSLSTSRALSMNATS